MHIRNRGIDALSRGDEETKERVVDRVGLSSSYGLADFLDMGGRRGLIVFKILEELFRLKLVSQHAKTIVFGGVAAMQVQSARQYKTGEIRQAQEELVGALRPYLDKAIIGYSWFGNEDLPPKKIRHSYRVFLLDITAPNEVKEKFRQRIKQIDYENGIVLN